jgi:hypothetical protein
MKKFALLALAASVAIQASAFADGNPNGGTSLDMPAPKVATQPAPKEALDRKTYLPYRQGPIDEVQPQDVMPLMKAGAASASISTGTGQVNCAGHTGAAWEAHKGLRLQEVLEHWAACDGWTVQWNTDRQYVLQASASFDGDFVAAAAELIGAFQKAEPPVKGDFHRNNKVLVTTTPTELDAN